MQKSLNLYHAPIFFLKKRYLQNNLKSMMTPGYTRSWRMFIRLLFQNCSEQCLLFCLFFLTVLFTLFLKRHWYSCGCFQLPCIFLELHFKVDFLFLTMSHFFCHLLASHLLRLALKQDILGEREGSITSMYLVYSHHISSVSQI